MKYRWESRGMARLGEVGVQTAKTKPRLSDRTCVEGVHKGFLLRKTPHCRQGEKGGKILLAAGEDPILDLKRSFAADGEKSRAFRKCDAFWNWLSSKKGSFPQGQSSTSGVDETDSGKGSVSGSESGKGPHSLLLQKKRGVISWKLEGKELCPRGAKKKLFFRKEWTRNHRVRELWGGGGKGAVEKA